MIDRASKKENEMLVKMGILDNDSLLSHLPRRYEDFALTPKEKIYSFSHGQKGVFLGSLSGAVKQYRFAHAAKCTFYFRTCYGPDIFVVAWNRPYLSKTLRPGEEYTLQVSYDAKEHCFQLLTLKKDKMEQRFVPVYSLPNDFPEHRFVRLIEYALDEGVPEILPSSLSTKYRLPPRTQAFRFCHQPKDAEGLRQGFRYFKYEEALLFCLRNQLIKKENQAIVKSRNVMAKEDAVEGFIRDLPYALTDDQRKAVGEIVADMNRPSVMNRLLQGDVGTGKTLVAAVALFANFTRYRQGALLAPTEALARQHAATLSGFFGKRLNVALLLGSTKPAERRAILAGLKDGTIDVAVGTHALFSSDVLYAGLGLVVIDEQHKFGVNQRVSMLGKGNEADLLLMSATPIPRTLALTLYGDMDVSTLEVFPAARREVTTMCVKHKDKRIRAAIERALSTDSSIYVVAPQIEESDDPYFRSAKKLYEGFAKVYPEETILLHGKMKAEEKEAALSAFVSGAKKILVATSLIEVGIDVPKARLLLVYEASHFSLSSLHQLRGRIGRDGRKALCMLIDEAQEEEAKQKLGILSSTEDGFEIAKADLAMRGFGELSGYKQSGLVDLRFASIVDDYKMFLAANEDAAYIADHPREHGHLIGLAKKASVTRG